MNKRLPAYLQVSFEDHKDGQRICVTDGLLYIYDLFDVVDGYISAESLSIFISTVESQFKRAYDGMAAYYYGA